MWYKTGATVFPVFKLRKLTFQRKCIEIFQCKSLMLCRSLTGRKYKCLKCCLEIIDFYDFMFRSVMWHKILSRHLLATRLVHLKNTSFFNFFLCWTRNSNKFNKLRPSTDRRQSSNCWQCTRPRGKTEETLLVVRASVEYMTSGMVGVNSGALWYLALCPIFAF